MFQPHSKDNQAGSCTKPWICSAICQFISRSSLKNKVKVIGLPAGFEEGGSRFFSELLRKQIVLFPARGDICCTKQEQSTV